MSVIVILYHSQAGHTEVQARAVAQGARKLDGSEVLLIRAEEAEKRGEDLDRADAIVFGSPTYMGSMSAELKKVFEWSSPRWSKGAWRNKIAAGFTNSGSQNGDKLQTLFSLCLFAMQHGMIWVGLDLLPGNNSSKGSPDDLNRMGSWLGAMAQSNIDQKADQVPIDSDLRTAEYFGHRVAKITAQFLAAAQKE